MPYLVIPQLAKWPVKSRIKRCSKFYRPIFLIYCFSFKPELAFASKRDLKGLVTVSSVIVASRYNKYSQIVFVELVIRHRML
jgi:hypothetical protein